MENFTKLYIWTLILIVLSSIVIGVKPEYDIQLPTSSGLTIIYPQNSYFKQYSTFELHFCAFNSSNIILTDNNVSCHIHIHNSTNGHLIERELTDFAHECKSIEINTSISNMSGIYPYLVWCNTSTEGGFVSGLFEITYNGLAPKTPIYFCLMMAIIVFACLLGAYISDKKHIVRKIVLFFMAFFNIIALIVGMIIIENDGNVTNALEALLWVNGLMIFAIIAFFVLYILKSSYGFKDNE